MKIGYDAKRFFHNATGLGNYSRDLIRVMAQFFPENSYFLYNYKTKKINKIATDNQIIVEKKYQGISFLAPFWRFSSIKKQLIDDQIDLFHGLSGEIPIGLRAKKIKSIVTIHDLIFVRYPNLYSFINRKIYFWKFHHAAKNANCVVAISEQTKRDVVHFLKIDASKIQVIYQGCAAVFKNKASETALANLKLKYNLPTNFVLNVGTIEVRKNVLSVIKALENTEIPLVIIGKKTKYYTEIKHFLKSRKMENQVFFLENIPLPELAFFYQAATIFVYPSVFEGFGIPIIEALFSKTPVITSTGSCFAEAGGPDSVYIEPNNVLQLKNAVVELWNNPSKRKLQAEKGYQFVQKFNDEPIANQWNALYVSLIQ